MFGAVGAYALAVALLHFGINNANRAISLSDEFRRRIADSRFMLPDG